MADKGGYRWSQLRITKNHSQTPALMKYSLGFSPCPNDTFIFDALVNKKIDTKGLEFDVILEDIQTLNEWSSEGKLDITKLSFPAFFKNQQHYDMLPSGGALGKG